MDGKIHNRLWYRTWHGVWWVLNRNMDARHMLTYKNEQHNSSHQAEGEYRSPCIALLA